MDLLEDKIKFKFNSHLNNEYKLLGSITDNFTCFINSIPIRN